MLAWRLVTGATHGLLGARRLDRQGVSARRRRLPRLLGLLWLGLLWLNRLLVDLVDRGLVRIERETLVIPDLERLEQLAAR